MKDPDSNIIYTCSDCSDDMYPLKGKFSAETVKSASAAKFLFGDPDDRESTTEHMWLINLDVSEDTVTGKLDNYPIHVDLAIGQIITRRISEVEELLFD